MTHSQADRRSGISGMGKAEQDKMRAVIENVDNSPDDETKQQMAHQALMDLKKLRSKQRKY